LPLFKVETGISMPQLIPTRKQRNTHTNPSCLGSEFKCKTLSIGKTHEHCGEMSGEMELFQMRKALNQI
jgi:hypothetical protein